MIRSSTVMVQTLTIAMLMAFADSVTAQQTYPNKLIRIITPYAPGGTTTIVGHVIGQKLTESWAKPVVVDNRPGGNGFIGGEALVKSPPDGHTVILITSTHIITPLLLPAPYDPIKDFAAVATLVSTEQVLVLHPSVAANNLQEFIALAKLKPGQLNYASAGSGGVPHLLGEMFNILAGTRMTHVPYKGSAPAIADLLGGHVHMFISPPIDAMPNIKAGKLKAIAMSGRTRLSALPEVPTFAEGGLPAFDGRIWFGLLAPAGTPKEIINKFSAEIARILVMPDLGEKLRGLEPLVSTSDQFGALMKADTTKFSNIIKTANIKIEG